MKWLSICLCLLLITCSKSPQNSNIGSQNLTDQFVGDFSFNISEFYTYMEAQTDSNGRTWEKTIDVYQMINSNGIIEKGTTLNQLIVNWDNDSIKYNYYHKGLNQYLNNSSIPIELIENTSDFKIDTNHIYTKIKDQYLIKDSFFAFLDNNGHFYKISGRRK